MTELEALQQIKNAGCAAAIANESRSNNPYHFVEETCQAYAWEDGYKKGRERLRERETYAQP